MALRGFRHAHAAISAPMYRRFREETPPDLLPWADPYIASLFGEGGDTLPESPAYLSLDADDEDPLPHR